MKEIKYVGRRGVLIRVTDGDEVSEIRFSDIKPYWQYAMESHFEGGKAILKDDIIIFSIITAGGQGEVIVGWDLVQNKVVHISNADYCIDFAVYKNMLYMLFDVNNFNTPSNICVYRIPLGTMDTNAEGAKLRSEETIKIYGEPELEVSENGIVVASKNARFVFASCPESAMVDDE